MALTFDVTEDDFWAGQEHLMFKTREMKRYFRFMLWIPAIIPLLLLPLLLSSPPGVSKWVPVLTILGTCLFTFGIIWLSLRLGVRLSRPLSRTFFRQVINQAIGRYELELVPKGLYIKTEHGEQIVYWNSIGNIAATPEHTFIYLTRMQSVIVPQKRILSGNYAAFMQAFADTYANQRDGALHTLTTTGDVPVEPTTVALPVTRETGLLHEPLQGAMNETSLRRN